MSEEAVLERARRAKVVLADATVLEAFEFITANLTEQWRHTATAQVQQREILHAQIAGLDAVKRQLASWVDQAKGVEIARAKAEQRRATSPLRLIGR